MTKLLLQAVATTCVCLLFITDLSAQCNGGPCDADRWEDGAAWNPDGSIDDAPNAGPPAGIVGCGNAANTQSNISPNSCYDSSIISVSAGTCIDPSTGLEVLVLPPDEGQEVAWFNFDVRELAGTFEFQVVNNSDQIAWALFYSNSPTNYVGGNGLSGDCNDLTFQYCGVNFNGWADQPYAVPDIMLPTNYYVMIWDRVDEDFGFNFKARFGCGDSDIAVCGIESTAETTVCNGDGTYTLTLDVTGINGQYTAVDPAAINISPDVCLGNTGAGTATSGSFTLVYPEGTDYNVTVSEISPSTLTCADPINSGDCGFTASGYSPSCCAGLDIACPEGGAFQCIADIPAADPAAVLINTACGPTSVTVSIVTTGTGCPSDIYTVTYTYTVDDGQSTASCDQVFTAADTTAPVAPAAPADVTVQCAGDVPAPTDLTATDNCDGDITVSPSEVFTPGACPNNYTVVRTWYFEDACGNNSSVSQTISVNDTTDPVLEDGPEDANYVCLSDVPAPPVLDATDNCGVVDVQFSETISDGDCPIIIERTWVATDACGNTDSYSQTIEVLDDIVPEIGDFDIQIWVECSELDALTIPATDNCSSLVTTYEDLLLSGGCLGLLQRTWTVTDGCGNSASAIQYISLMDTQGPVFDGVPADMVFNCEDAIPSLPSVTASDACSEATLTFESAEIQGACSTQDDLVWTWTATDACGNVSTASTTITFQELPPLDAETCPEDFNGDGQVNTLDMLMLIGEFDCEGPDCACDLTGDGRVDTMDTLQLLGVFGTECP